MENICFSFYKLMFNVDSPPTISTTLPSDLHVPFKIVHLFFGIENVVFYVWQTGKQVLLVWS